MRPVKKGEAPKTYTAYKYAKDDLIERLGYYCSYCEMNISNQADVEHVAPKSKNKDLELEWDNFLLGCKACNILKSNNNNDRIGYPFPDEYNTAYLFSYKNGKVEIRDGLNVEDQAMAKKLFELVQLDREKQTSGQNDDRCYSRQLEFKKACDSLNRYKDYIALEPSEELLNIYIENHIVTAFFSVWLEVFKDYPRVKKVILENIPGTAMECYDENMEPKENIERI